MRGSLNENTTPGYHPAVFDRKPVIGIAGGIGGGKTFVADLFGELGAVVIHADEQVRAAYSDPAVLSALRGHFGDAVFHTDRSVDRPALAKTIFTDPAARVWLERLLHPIVAVDRVRRMKESVGDPAVTAFVLDTPLLFETGGHRDCDAVVFVDAPAAARLARVEKARRWAASELTRRENLQMPLDKKREMSDYVIVNTAEAGDLRRQVRTAFSRILRQ